MTRKRSEKGRAKARGKRSKEAMKKERTVAEAAEVPGPVHPMKMPSRPTVE